MEWNRKLRRRRQVKTSTEKRPNGTYTVKLSLDDDMGSVMDLRLMVIHQDMAEALSDRFQRSPERLYSEIIKTLLDDYKD